MESEKAWSQRRHGVREGMESEKAWSQRRHGVREGMQWLYHKSRMAQLNKCEVIILKNFFLIFF